MATYLPYSQLIENISNTVRQKLNSPNLVMDWQVFETTGSVTNDSSAIAISEIYY